MLQRDRLYNPSYFTIIHLFVAFAIFLLCIDRAVIVYLKPYIVFDQPFGNKDPPTCIYKVSKTFEEIHIFGSTDSVPCCLIFIIEKTT